jgi:hypothetical protein
LQTGAVIGITRSDVNANVAISDYQDLLEQEGLILPILEIDARVKDDVLLLLDMLMATVEMNQPEIDIEENHEQHDPFFSL